MVTLLNRGVLSKKEREKCIVKTTKKKVKDGKSSFSGNRFLKGTQLETELWWQLLFVFFVIFSFVFWFCKL